MNIRKAIKNTLLVLLVFITIFGFYFAFSIYRNRNSLCFYDHVSDAIKVNIDRKPYYSSITNKVSEPASNKLIRNEILILPVALWVDANAGNYIRSGIPIVCNDFVDMTEVNPKEVEPIYRNIANESAFENLQGKMLITKELMYLSNRKGNFKAVSEESYKFLSYIEEKEQETNSNFCMAKHITESIGLASLHASKYSTDSMQKVDNFAKSFLTIKISGLNKYILNIDRSAQQAQALGAGIVCNDVPHIPFKEEYESKL